MRWDKNFLTVIQLTLVRRKTFRVYGGVRFGGTVTAEQAFKMGFDHVAIAAGAGRPTIVGMKNNMIRGIRQASDFLMALQLTGAFKKNGLANLQARAARGRHRRRPDGDRHGDRAARVLPARSRKDLRQYEALAAAQGEEHLRQHFDDEEREILDGLLAHGHGRSKRERAGRRGR